MSIVQVYFSPSGTSSRISDKFLSVFGNSTKTVDLLIMPPENKIILNEDDFILFTLPVFAGRVPSVCVDMLNKIKGSNTPAVVTVVFGNRAYEDSLLELADIVESNGFKVIGGGAFVARHSIFNEMAQSRPDEADIASVISFAKECKEKLSKGNKESVVDKISGTRPYREPTQIPIVPTGNDDCIECGMCAEICPKEAIPFDDLRVTDKEKCITCTACIHGCPNKARNFFDPSFPAIKGMFLKQFAGTRKEPELFI